MIIIEASDSAKNDSDNELLSLLNHHWKHSKNLWQFLKSSN